ncbi:MAG: hypothetical protein UX00_C0005G0003 [Microgenomates group bacterium GW2011_GWB1_45_17]|nr:MAG: hypothetical protein UT44_C0035G0005 [Candidatus Levybacteria bacterium GW2011_GWA1_39_32]KKT98058.1 MAG: hypothetical protein UX00_C0005G0003 [Microgenomates group bacterium GW2011_GWB1_45_17]KKU24769.1 MAG: hypothetical protein UX36_C0001G0386 [Microgenomates group bacterium GW2011_GWC1_46_15]
MHKLAALVPLLGWFYFTIGGYAIFSWITKDKFSFMKRVFFVVFGLYATMLSFQSLRSEVMLYKETRKTLFDTFYQKISYEAGTYYDMYYHAFRLAMPNGKYVIHLEDVPTRELHYARMYLYPDSVFIVDHVPAVAGNFGIVRESTKSAIVKQSDTILIYGGKQLIRVKGAQ